jgi:hypothetical protein
VALTELHSSGARIAVSGIARAGHVGQAVTVGVAGGGVARTTVRADGTFQTTFARPRRAQRRAAYTATVAGQRSKALRPSPLAIVGQTRVGTRVRIRGRLTGSGSAGRRIDVVRRLGCPASSVSAGSGVRTSHDGAFTLTLPRPVAPHAVGVYRISLRGARSKSTLVLVRHDA